MSRSMRQNEIKWIKNDSYGFPLWIALTSDPDRIIHLRNRFVFISAKNFNREHIQRALPSLDKEFDVPDEMAITAFSDKDMIKRGINSLGLCIRFPSTPKTGYYRAYYYRSRDGGVSLKYSPDPEKEELLLIDLSSDSVG